MILLLKIVAHIVLILSFDFIQLIAFNPLGIAFILYNLLIYQFNFDAKLKVAILVIVLKIYGLFLFKLPFQSLHEILIEASLLSFLVSVVYAISQKK